MSGFDQSKATSSIVTVGSGRGFVVEAGTERLVITAAHCLPELPPAAPFVPVREKTYEELLGQLGDGPAIAAECRFADPISDIAVLGPPDEQELWHEREFYDALTEAAPPLPVIDKPDEGWGWLLSLDGTWSRDKLWSIKGGPLTIHARDIAGGMSGSPILADNGSAIGVVCCSSVQAKKEHRQDGSNPRLSVHLPGWLLRALL